MRRAAPPRLHPMARWHRLIGIVSSVIVVVTIVTGIVLNHTNGLQLGRQHLNSPSINRWYGRVAPAIESGFAVADSWVLQAGSRVFFDGNEVYRHDAQLTGALVQADALYVLFDDELVELDNGFNVVDVYTALDGLAPPLTRIATSPSAVVVETARGAMYIDRASGQWHATDATQAPHWIEPASPPADVIAAVSAGFAGDGVTLERVLTDLHSGRLFGSPGALIVDLAALAMLLLAISGVYLWFKFKRGNGLAPRRDGSGPPP